MRRRPLWEAVMRHLIVKLSQPQPSVYGAAELQEAVRVASARAFLAGQAQGDIDGRLALAHELQIQHGEGGGERPMTQDELDILVKRQVH